MRDNIVVRFKSLNLNSILNLIQFLTLETNSDSVIEMTFIEFVVPCRLTFIESMKAPLFFDWLSSYFLLVIEEYKLTQFHYTRLSLT